MAADGASHSASLQRMPISSSTASVRSLSSHLSVPTTAPTASPQVYIELRAGFSKEKGSSIDSAIFLQLSTPPGSTVTNVVHLPPTHDETSSSSSTVPASKFLPSLDDIKTTPTTAVSRGISPSALQLSSQPLMKRVSVDIRKQTAITECSHDSKLSWALAWITDVLPTAKQQADTPQRKKRGLEGEHSLVYSVRIQTHKASFFSMQPLAVRPADFAWSTTSLTGSNSSSSPVYTYHSLLDVSLYYTRMLMLAVHTGLF